MTKKQREQEEARVELRKLCPPGTTIYTSLRHVSRNGMYRLIQVHIIRNNEPRWLSSLVARALGCRLKHDAVGISGCGMDMGFHLVHSLSYALHGYESKGVAAAMEKPGIPFNNPRRGHFRAGYSLKHRWL